MRAKKPVKMKKKARKSPGNNNVKAVIGLGNPGNRYRSTRHNAGFLLLDALTVRHHLRMKAGKGEYMIALSDDEATAYVKPLTYMNKSGTAARDLLRHYDIMPEDMLILHDDLDLSLGKMKFKDGGSAGTHNGLRSVIYALGSDAFPRLKIGIDIEGRRENWSPEDFVLSRFSPLEEKVLEEIIPLASDAVDVYVAEGLGSAMNRYNQRSLKQE